MKYMLMMHYGAPVDGEVGPIHTWPPQDIKAHIDFMIQLAKDLGASGELVMAEGLAGPEQAKSVKARKGGGAPVVTDGPFPESKEMLAGFWIVDVEGPQRAIDIAARASSAPGPRGVPINIPIEMRQVMQAPGDEGVSQG